MSTPVPQNRREEAALAMKQSDDDAELEMNVDDQVKADLLTYKANKEARDNLRRSLAKQSMGQQH